jgi:hypothetical protein
MQLTASKREVYGSDVCRRRAYAPIQGSRLAAADLLAR